MKLGFLKRFEYVAINYDVWEECMGTRIQEIGINGRQNEVYEQSG